MGMAAEVVWARSAPLLGAEFHTQRLGEGGKGEKMSGEQGRGTQPRGCPLQTAALPGLLLSAWAVAALGPVNSGAFIL